MINRECFKRVEVLETERLILREISEDDVDEVYALFSDPEVVKYDWIEEMMFKEEALHFIWHCEGKTKLKQEIVWGIELKETGRLIGICSIANFNMDARRGEIGYSILRCEWNKGYATEATKIVTEYCLKVMNVNRIEAFITPENEPSVRVLEKINYTCEGIVRERDFIKGKLEDSVVMAILQKDAILMLKNSENEGMLRYNSENT